MMTPPEFGEWNPSGTMPAEFFAVARAVYRDQPHWIAESESAIRQQFSAANRWFRQGRAWLGVNGEQARLAGFFNPSLQVDGAPAIFFGYFESVDDASVSAPLFNGLRQWANQLGVKHIYGPINFTTFGQYRIRLDQFDAPPFPGEPFSPDYYPALLEANGLSLRYRYATRINRDTSTLLPAVEKYYAPLRERVRQQFRIETIDGDFWRAHLTQIYPLVDSIFANNFAYSSIDFDTFSRQCGEPFARRLCPHSSVAAFDGDNRLAGFFLCFPDYGSLLQQGRSHRVAESELNFAEHFPLLPAPRLALAKTGGVYPDYREGGLFSALSCELTARLLPHYQHVAGAMVREDNRSLNFAARFGEEAHHYGLFSQTLADSA